MRKIVAVSALSIAVVGAGLAACSSAKSPSEATTADVERDLNLAGSVQGPRTGIVSSIEQTSNGAPSGNSAGKRLAVPTRKRAPSAAPSPVTEEAPAAPPTVHELDATTAVATAEVAAVVAPVPQSAPIMMVTDPMRSAPSTSGGPSASAGNDMGSGDVGGSGEGHGAGRAGGGVIIRGGGAGHDNCEPPARRGPTGIIGSIFGGGMGGVAGGGMSGGAAGRLPRR